MGNFVCAVLGDQLFFFWKANSKGRPRQIAETQGEKARQWAVRQSNKLEKYFI